MRRIGNGLFETSLDHAKGKILLRDQHAALEQICMHQMDAVRYIGR